LVLIVGTLSVLFARPLPRRLDYSFGWTLGILIILAWSTIAALLGLLHHRSLYAIAIDYRVMVYLGIGYVAARLLFRAQEDGRVIRAILLIGLIGFVTQQVLVSAHAFSIRNAVQTGQVDAYRDITVPFFIGSYGILLCVAYVQSGRGRVRLASVLGLAAGLAALFATFIRSAWLATGAGLVVLAALSGRRAVARLGIACLALGLAIVVAADLVPVVRVVVQTAERRAIEAVLPSSGPYFVNTLDTRLQESRIALGHLRNPIDWATGAGLGLIVSLNNPFQHDSVIWLVSKEGLIGAGIFILVIIVLPLRSGLRTLWFGPDSSERLLLTVLMASLITGAVGSLATGGFTYAPWMPVVGFTIAWIEQLTSLRYQPRLAPGDVRSRMQPIG
jgi:hypothetical protein